MREATVVHCNCWIAAVVSGVITTVILSVLALAFLRFIDARIDLRPVNR